MFFLYSPVLLLQHWIHSTTALFWHLFFALLRWLVLNPVFPWGVWAIFPCVPNKFCQSLLFAFHRQFFAFCACLPFSWGVGRMAAAWYWRVHTCGDSALPSAFLWPGPRSSHSQLHFSSFSSVGLETVEKFQRTLTVTFWAFISFSCPISSSTSVRAPGSPTVSSGPSVLVIH